MIVPIIALVLLLTGCATYESPPAKGKRRGESFAVDPNDAELWDAATRAAAAWSYALGLADPLVVSEDGNIPILWSDAINEEPGCERPPDALPGYTGGCSAGAGAPDAHIFVNGVASSRHERLYRWLIHEMGHILAGRGGHLGDPGFPALRNPLSVMSRYVSDNFSSLLTLEDVEYVCQSPTGIECPGELGRVSRTAQEQG